MQKQLVMSKVDASYKPEFHSMAQCVSRSVQLNGIRYACILLARHVHRTSPSAVPHVSYRRACALFATRRVTQWGHLPRVRRGPFQGFGPTLMRNIPAAALYFGTFENAKLAFSRRSGRAPEFYEVNTRSASADVVVAPILSCASGFGVGVASLRGSIAWVGVGAKG